MYANCVLRMYAAQKCTVWASFDLEASFWAPSLTLELLWSACAVIRNILAVYKDRIKIAHANLNKVAFLVDVAATIEFLLVGNNFLVF